MNIFLRRTNVVLIIVYLVIILPVWIGLLKGSPPSWPVASTLSRSIAAEHKEIQERSKIKLLNMTMPPGYSDLAELSFSRRDPQSVDLDSYIGYYNQAALVLPSPLNADAHAMLGFCYYHQGKTKDAYDSYLKSLAENPVFVWTYNNLALLRFKEGNYEQAAMLLNQGLAVNPEISLKIILSSKIYTDILRDSKGNVDWPSELKRTYSEAGRMLVISLYRLGKFPQTVQTAQYAISSGLEPSGFFNYYMGLALEASGDHLKAQEFLSAAGTAAKQTDLLTGEDLSVRIF